MAAKPLLTVFAVDDEPVIVETLIAILTISGFDARGFENGADAIQAVESGCPDLLITDVSMPGMNGIDLAIRFKSLCPNCKIVLFSGHLTTGPLLTIASTEGHDFVCLAKPVHPKDLLSAIRDL